MLSREEKNRRNAARMAAKLLDPDYRDKRNADNRRTHAADPRGKMLCSARERAKAKGIPFSLTKADIAVPEACPILGLPITCGDGKLSDGSPTLDRVIPSLGYVPGNVIVISHKANRIKSNASPEEIHRVAEWLASEEARNILRRAEASVSVSGNGARKATNADASGLVIGEPK